MHRGNWGVGAQGQHIWEVLILSQPDEAVQCTLSVGRELVPLRHLIENTQQATSENDGNVARRGVYVRYAQGRFIGARGRHGFSEC
mmetsp:Transcript_6574/g.12992  ORF Transcript_6574/g.12992 Transcript_6574/m.12992 type:complete len:86 (-) Transcript_6574:167-424(-)